MASAEDSPPPQAPPSRPGSSLGAPEAPAPPATPVKPNAFERMMRNAKTPTTTSNSDNSIVGKKHQLSPESSNSTRTVASSSTTFLNRDEFEAWEKAAAIRTMPLLKCPNCGTGPGASFSNKGGCGTKDQKGVRRLSLFCNKCETSFRFYAALLKTPSLHDVHTTWTQHHDSLPVAIKKPKTDGGRSRSTSRTPPSRNSSTSRTRSSSVSAAAIRATHALQDTEDDHTTDPPVISTTGGPIEPKLRTGTQGEVGNRSGDMALPVGSRSGHSGTAAAATTTSTIPGHSATDSEAIANNNTTDGVEGMEGVVTEDLGTVSEVVDAEMTGNAVSMHDPNPSPIIGGSATHQLALSTNNNTGTEYRKGKNVERRGNGSGGVEMGGGLENGTGSSTITTTTHPKAPAAHSHSQHNSTTTAEERGRTRVSPHHQRPRNPTKLRSFSTITPHPRSPTPTPTTLAAALDIISTLHRRLYLVEEAVD
ncbi:hypothetical protein HK102_010295, partial [Quaeritorhiza haematococci]